MEPFDATTTPLESGFTLIEASAGTGKTTAITAIVLRLIIEENVRLENILVTTYTDLATAELRGRIRETLRDALAALGGEATRNEIVAAVVARAQDRKEAAHRVENALRVFDDAAIYTIHGFCGRVLADRAFESGALFQTELMTDPSSLLREVTQDFWRTEFYPAPPIISALAKGGSVTVTALQKLLLESTTNPSMRVIPDAMQLATLKVQADQDWNELCRSFVESASEIDAIFSDLAWAGNQHQYHARAREHLAMLHDLLPTRGVPGDFQKTIALFSASRVAAQTRVNQITPRHAWFDRCERMLELAQKFPLAIQVRFLHWAREALRRRKADRQVHTFDDLLTQLDAALRGPRGRELKESLRHQYQAALVDEFQDTDPVQYSTFAQIYEGTDARVFLIGDPKQSIYGFRGADVFTYLGAARKAAREYSLPKNWRSEAKLVDAVNEIFAARDASFVIDGIRFEGATAAGEADRTPFSIEGRSGQPLQIWLAPDQDEKSIAEAVAGEIARLLHDHATLGDRRVTPSDIAVLVSTNAQPVAIQKALSRHRIPTVVYSAASVFHSREAKDLRLILEAVADPTSEEKVRAALATDALGFTAAELERLAANEPYWETRLNHFAEYHELWREHSFVRMINKLFVEEKVRPRLLAYADGDRRLTNLFHLTALLHCAEAEARLGIDGLLLWFTREIHDDKFAREGTELRLESDDKAVRIVTIHKSKGLEYPITFCPFSWHAPRPRDFVKFHQDEDLVLDLEASDASKKRQRVETLAESVRQFYVALTRAQHRSYLVWAKRGNPSKSAPAWLFSNASVEEMEAGVAGAAVTSAIEKKFEGSRVIAVAPLPEGSAPEMSGLDAEPADFRPRIFRGEIDRNWGVSSFTSLISARTETPEARDYDAAEGEEMEGPVATTEGIHGFPGGTRVGTCLHSILEDLDFSDSSQLQSRVAEKLALFRLASFEQVVSETLEKLLRVPLGQDGFTLSQVPKKACLSELEFTFPVEALTTTRLRGVFAPAEVPLEIDRLRFPAANGFIMGFIDLVFERAGRFYLADWKSNWLGPSSASYNPETIAAAMREHFYWLQLSIYTVAIHRYLRARLPAYDYERHFGGAFYIFLRGADPSHPQKSIYAARPALAEIEKLDAVIHGRD